MLYSSKYLVSILPLNINILVLHDYTVTFFYNTYFNARSKRDFNKKNN